MKLVNSNSRATSNSVTAVTSAALMALGATSFAETNTKILDEARANVRPHLAKVPLNAELSLLTHSIQISDSLSTLSTSSFSSRNSTSFTFQFKALTLCNTVATATTPPSSTFIPNFPSEGRPNSVFVMHPNTLGDKLNPKASTLSSQILLAGGRVAVLACEQVPIETLRRYFPLVDDKTITERVSYLQMPKDKFTRQAWIRDYLGHSVISGTQISLVDSDYCYAGFLQTVPSPEDQITPKVAKQLGVSTRKLNLVIEGGNMVPIGDDALVVNDRVFLRNHTLTKDQVIEELRTLGRPNIIIIPYTQGFFHADLLVTGIGQTAVVASLPTNYAQEPGFKVLDEELQRDVIAAAEIFETTAVSISKAGYSVVRVPIHLNEVVRPDGWTGPRGSSDSRAKPDSTAASLNTYIISPVNVTQVRGDDGKLTVLVPFPEYTQGSQKYPNPHSASEEKWKQDTILAFRKAGADNVLFTYYFPFHNQGQNHCRTMEMPADVAMKLAQ